MATNKKITRVGGGESIAPPASSSPAPASAAAAGQKWAPTAEAQGRASKLRLWAALAWIAAIAAEVGAIWWLIKSPKPLDTAAWVWIVGFVVVDLVLVIVGSSIWKKANRLDPASRADGVRFFVQNQLGVIISVIAFLPLVVLVFTNKDLSGKEKGILGGLAAVALVVAGLASADFNPPSVEQYTEQTQRVEQLTGGQNLVYWTQYGNRYHIYDDCRHLQGDRTHEIFNGTVAQARELKNITQLCSVCETRAEHDHQVAPVLPEGN
jgi:hypothetical protein